MLPRLVHLVALLAVLALGLMPLAPAQAHCAAAVASEQAMQADDLPKPDGFEETARAAEMPCCPDGDLSGGNCQTVCVQLTALPSFPDGAKPARASNHLVTIHRHLAEWIAPPVKEPPRLTLQS